MGLIDRATTRLLKDMNKALYNSASKQILATQPLTRGDMPFIALSMVHQRDVLSYLVAIKSFAHFVNPERVVIVCDPSITDQDRDVFRKHIPHVELRHAEEFQNSLIPKGGCWERLSAITTYSPLSYVVQLDADTLTIDKIPEVSQAVMHQRGFVLGEESGQRVVSLAETAEIARPWLSPTVHIQGLAETVMEAAGLKYDRYVRGCAGFCGFPKTNNLQEDFLDFSKKMTEKVGTRWSEWGTEQVASNYLVANVTDTMVLPYPKYTTPDIRSQETAFLHFIGPMRFTSRTYEKMSKEIIKRLR